MTQYCTCGLEIPFNEMLRKCTRCGKKMCVHCMAAKMHAESMTQQFLCGKCLGEYRGKFTLIKNDICGVQSPGSFVAWAVFDDAINDIMKVNVNGSDMAGYSKEIEQISRLADKLMSNYVAPKNFHIGRVWVPKDTSLKPVRIMMGEVSKVVVIGG